MYKVLYYDIYAEYYQSIKQYQQASAYIDTTLTMLKKDFTSDYAEQLLKQAKIWVEAEDYNKATTLYQQALAIKDSAAMALSNTQMEQIKKSYNLDKIELKQQKQTNQIRLTSLVAITAILIVLFISLFRLFKIRKALKYSESEIRKAAETVRVTNEIKNRFLSNMSYNIRTPLNNVVGFSQLIADATSKEEQEEYQRIVMLNNNLLLTLIEDVLNLSVLDSGKMTFNNTVFNLSEMFGDLAIQMKDKVKLPGREFIYEVPLQEVQVKADRERLTQIVTNLITNAAKFTRQGYIKMGYALKDSGVEIYVKDTGMGIEEKNLTEIFKRFKKLNSFIQGTGLGLPICKSITEQMEGKIWVESEYGKGSVFHVWLPCLA